MIGFRVHALSSSKPLSAILPTYAQAMRFVREFNSSTNPNPIALVIRAVAFAKAGDCFFDYNAQSDNPTNGETK